MPASPRALRKRSNTRARLIDAATEVFIAKGISGARIDDIVSRAGFTRGAFYSNYSSIDDILRDVLIERSNRTVDDLQEAFVHLDGTPTIDSIMTVLDTVRSNQQSTYILAMEYNLYRMRHSLAGEDLAEFPLAQREHIERAVTSIISDVLARMGRRALFPTGTIARMLTIFYLDSLSPDYFGVDTDDSDLLRQVIEAIIVAFSTPRAVQHREQVVSSSTRAGVWGRDARD